MVKLGYRYGALFLNWLNILCHVPSRRTARGPPKKSPTFQNTGKRYTEI